MLHGIDIYEGDAYNPAGQDFVILKATEGVTFNDHTFHSRWADLGSRGFLRGAYHFAHPGNSAAAEASHFLSVVRPVLKAGDWAILDFEVTDGQSPGHCAAWAQQWCDLVHTATGRRPVVYTFLSFAQDGNCAGLGGYPLWMADPSRPAGQPRVPGPWSGWVLHQYSDAGLDRDVFNGDRGAWLALGGDQPSNPIPQEDDVLYGQLDNGQGAITPISMPQNSARAIGFTADNGLQGLPPAKLRVAVHDKAGWHVTEGVLVDASKAKAVVTFRDPASTDGVSVRREDKGDVRVAWDAS